MQEYQCHKKVMAAQITAITLMGSEGAIIDLGPDGQVKCDVAFMQKHNPQVGGYLVEYDGGTYTSYSPAEAFENGYRLTSALLSEQEGAYLLAVAAQNMIGLLAVGTPGTDEELALRATQIGVAIMAEVKKRTVQ